jgi:hypothetical protein
MSTSTIPGRPEQQNLDPPAPSALPPEPPRDRPKAGLRVTVNLSPLATAALNDLVELTGDSKTEAINKALQAYAEIQKRQHRGGGAWLQDDANSRPTQTRFY